MGDQRDPEIDSDQTGAAVVVWSSYGQDGELGGIYAQRFDRKGLPVGPEFAVNQFTDGHQTEPQLSVDKQQGFWVSWGTMNAEGRHSALSLRRFAAAGQPMTEEITIPALAGATIHLRRIQAIATGGAIVHWRDHTASGTGILRRLELDPAGRPVGVPAVVGEESAP